MKARVKATGEILEIAEYSTIYLENYDSCFYPSDLEFLDVKGNAFPKDDNPDYWTRLEHQYAGMAMQGLLTNSNLTKLLRDENVSVRDKTHLLSEWAKMYAHALVQKLKEKEERK